MTPLNDTANKILDVAEAYTQTLGFNSFSYKGIAEKVGVKTSSIHYYFPTKQDLAFAMTERFVGNYRNALAGLKAQHKQGIKLLTALSDLYIDVVKQGKFCLCGMLASDLAALPASANSKLQEFFTLNELWIADAVELAKQQGDINDSVDAKNTASLFLAALEGGMLIARTQKHPGFLEASVEAFFNVIKTT